MKGSAAGCARGGAPAEFETLEPFRRSCFVMGWPGGCPKIRELRYVSFIFWPGAARVSTSWKPTLPESIARWGSACMMLMASSAQLRSTPKRAHRLEAGVGRGVKKVGGPCTYTIHTRVLLVGNAL